MIALLQMYRDNTPGIIALIDYRMIALPSDGSTNNFWNDMIAG